MRLQRVIPLLCGLMAGQARLAGEFGKLERKGVTYLTYRCRPPEVQLFWRDASGQRYGQLRRLQEDLARDGLALEFGMNAGIFEPDGTPSGLHVENGREILPLNRKAGRGNFYLQPNGVFAVVGDRAIILSTEEYAAAGLKPRIALQSGPLLLRNGATHPAFRSASSSRLHRNGVGIAANGDVFFAMTEFRDDNRVNLFDFADFFRAQGCRDALFLDGDISALEIPGRRPIRPGNFYGALLGVTAKMPTGSPP